MDTSSKENTMTPEDLQRQLDDLKRKVDGIAINSTNRFQGTIPGDSNFKLASKTSRDPGHYHTFVPHGYIVFSSTWESLDGFVETVSGTATIENVIMYLFLDTGDTINSIANPLMTQLFFDYASDYGFQAAMYIGSTTNNTVYFGMGDIPLGGSATEGGIGFKVVNGAVSAIVNVAGAETAVVITSSVGTLAEYHTYRAVKTKDGVVFTVDEKVVATIPTVPSDTLGVTGTGLSFYIKNTTAASKTLKCWGASMFVKPI